MRTLVTTRLTRSLIVLALGAVVLASCDESSFDDEVSEEGSILGDDFDRTFAQGANDLPMEVDGLDLATLSGRDPFEP